MKTDSGFQLLKIDSFPDDVFYEPGIGILLNILARPDESVRTGVALLYFLFFNEQKTSSKDQHVKNFGNKVSGIVNTIALLFFCRTGLTGLTEEFASIIFYRTEQTELTEEFASLFFVAGVVSA